MQLRTLQCLSLLAMCAFSVPAVAADTETEDATRDRAMELYENGRALYDEGSYEQAYVAWEASYKLSEEPALLFNMANALERLNRLEEAVATLNQYRVFAPADERETLERRLRSMEKRLDAQRVAEKEREEAAKVAAAPPVETQPDVIRMEDVAPARRGPSTQKIAGYSAIGVGVAGLATAGGLYGAASGAQQRGLDGCVGTLCSADSAAHFNQAQGLGTGGHIAVGVGAAATITGVVLVVLDSKSNSRAVTVSPLTPAGDNTATGVVFSGRF